MQVNAAAATQQMIDVFDMKGIVHFGIAGNINNSMSIGDVSIPKQIMNAGLWDWLVNKNTTSLIFFFLVNNKFDINILILLCIV